MKKLLVLPCLLAIAGLLTLMTPSARTDESFAKVAEEVNQKLVKLFGSGGIKGLASYGTGVLVSPDGYILTVNSHILDTRDLRIHTVRRHRATTARWWPASRSWTWPWCKIDRKRKVEIEHYFDVVEGDQAARARAGHGVLAFSNQFQIATRDEPMSVQRGVIAAYSKLHRPHRRLRGGVPRQRLRDRRHHQQPRGGRRRRSPRARASCSA